MSIQGFNAGQFDIADAHSEQDLINAGFGFINVTCYPRIQLS